MVVSLLAFAAVGGGLLLWGRRLGHNAFLLAAVVPALSGLWLLTETSPVVGGVHVRERVTWVDGLGLAVDLRLDGMALTMSLLVVGIGVLVLVYAREYFGPDAPDLNRAAGLLVLFAGAMVGLVQADHLLVLYTCWELTSITSYLLIGHHHTDASARAAALHALLVTSAGGLAMFGGFVLLGQTTGTYRLSELLADPPDLGGATINVALVLILLGALTKSAQYPFHAWLPGAMAAPTPISAYLHSATMVKAGVYLVARLAPMFAAAVVWRPLVVTAGLVTLIVGGLRALRQHDLKLLLAFGTVSQLGLMVVLFGVGTPAATAAGWSFLVGHALFKAALFLVVGILDHQTGTRDIRELPALGRGWLGVEVISTVSAASMAGVPLLAGFVAKEAAYAALSDGGFGASAVVLAAVVAGSMLTVAYAARFHWGAFIAPRAKARSGSAPPPATGFVAPGAVVAAGTVVLGLVPFVADRLATAATQALEPTAPAVHLALWHGFGVPLALSATTLAVGAFLSFRNRTTQHVLATGRGLPRGEAVYLVVLRAVGAVARRTTAIVQNGSLPIYCGVILLTAAILPVSVLVAAGDFSWPPLGALRDVPAAVMLVVAALGAAVVRRRFSAAVFLGVAGYAMAGMFVLYGAPDLALTQVVVETLSTVVFVLVLGRLPERFERQSTRRRRILRLGAAGAVGVAVFVFALSASADRPEPVVSNEMVARSVPDGHGRNVVNVTLVDFRGLDTLGEITVLAVASIGAVAIARAGRRAAGVATTGLPGPLPTLSAVRRLVFFDVSVGLIFHVVMMASVWLLFAGHNQPGGGFVGGLLAGSAITLRYIAGGMDEVRSRTRFRPWTVLGAGLLLATTTAILPMLRGGALLEVAYRSVDVGAFGTLGLSSAQAFDTGVYLTVVGMVLMAFEAFGDQLPDEAAA
jgi:multicomponent Na+:H+ antiporter subunit A